MKKQKFIYRGLLFLLLSFLITSCGDKKKELIKLTEKIVYEMPIANSEADLEWWIRNIEGPDRDSFLNLIMNAANSGKFKISDKDSNKFPIADGKHLSIKYLRFEEEWFYNKENAQIEKNVKSITPCLEIIDSITCEIIDFIPIFTLIPKFETENKQKDMSPCFDNLITDRIQYDVYIKNPYTHNQNDWWHNNLIATTRLNYINFILEIAISDKVQVYDYSYNPIPTSDIEYLLTHTDTFITIDSEPPYNEIEKIISYKLDKNEIAKIRFLERWTLNSKTMQMNKEVLGVCLMKENYGENGNMRGYTPMFWLFFNKNYPKVLNLN